MGGGPSDAARRRYRGIRTWPADGADERKLLLLNLLGAAGRGFLLRLCACAHVRVRGRCLHLLAHARPRHRRALLPPASAHARVRMLSAGPAGGAMAGEDPLHRGEAPPGSSPLLGE